MGVALQEPDRVEVDKTEGEAAEVAVAIGEAVTPPTVPVTVDEVEALLLAELQLEKEAVPEGLLEGEGEGEVEGKDGVAPKEKEGLTVAEKTNDRVPPTNDAVGLEEDNNDTAFVEEAAFVGEK